MLMYIQGLMKHYEYLKQKIPLQVKINYGQQYYTL